MKSTDISLESSALLMSACAAKNTKIAQNTVHSAVCIIIGWYISPLIQRKRADIFKNYCDESEITLCHSACNQSAELVYNESKVILNKSPITVT